MSNLTENRINEVIDPAVVTTINTAIADIESNLPAGSLDDEQRKSYAAIDVNNKVFTEDVLAEMQSNDMKQTAMPHVGEQLNAYFKKHRIFKAALARVMGKTKSTIQKYVKRPSLQLRILWELSYALRHNFIRDLADQLPANFTTNAIQDTTKDEEIERLKRELNLAKAQITVLYDIAMGKKSLPKQE